MSKENEDVMRYLRARFPTHKIALFTYDYSTFVEDQTVAEQCLNNFCCAQHAAQAIANTLNSILSDEVDETTFHNMERFDA